MSSVKSNAFTLPYTFFREPAAKVITDLKAAGLSGINLALNYHASRDFLLRQGPQLEYLSDGFHYYKVDKSKYEAGALTPAEFDQLPSNQLLENVLAEAAKQEFEVNAWAVYLHNSAIGMTHPSATVTNVFGNKFLSELCPINKAVQGYVIGMTKDLASRGVKSIMAESLHFHGARHGEHHERFFMELSPVTEFLFSLCFCESCKSNFAGDANLLAEKIKQLLQTVFDDKDPWLGKALTKEFLAQLAGEEILQYLTARENAVSDLYKQTVATAHAAGVVFKYEDQSPLIDIKSTNSLERSWEIGINNQQISTLVDYYEPLIYRATESQVADLADSYKKSISAKVSAILRPTYPDCTEKDNLIKKVERLKQLDITEIDFYLLDTFRTRDLNWIKEAIKIGG
jgi:hypothetical protein